MASWKQASASAHRSRAGSVDGDVAEKEGQCAGERAVGERGAVDDFAQPQRSHGRPGEEAGVVSQLVRMLEQSDCVPDQLRARALPPEKTRAIPSLIVAKNSVRVSPQAAASAGICLAICIIASASPA